MKNLKIVIGIIIVVCMIAGCATIEINETEGTYKYTRFGNQELIDVRIKMDRKAEGDLKMDASLGKQDSDPEIAELLKEIRKMLQDVMRALPGIL